MASLVSVPFSVRPFSITSVPWAIVPPLKLSPLPPRVSVPVPVFARVTLPAPSSTKPEKVVDWLLAPTPSVAVPATLLVTVPPPARLPTLGL